MPQYFPESAEIMIFPAIVHLSTGKHFRGGERQALLLHNGLLEKGYKSLLICRAKGELSRQHTSSLSSVSWKGEWDASGLMRIITRCKSASPSIIHCHDAHSFTHGIIAGSLLRIPVVYTRRVVFPLRNNIFSNWKYGKCRLFIAISKAVALQCLRIAGQERIRIVPDGVEWRKPSLSRAEARTLLGIPDGCFAIGTVGHFTHEKNLPLIATLAGALKKEKKDVRIVCVGPYGADLEYPDNMIFTGYKPNASDCYAAFDAYISGSMNEGLGSALIDAVVRDIPVVAVDAGGTRDIFPENRPLVSSGDESGLILSVKKIIDNHEKALSDAKKCGIRARAIFSVENMVNKTIEAYKSVIKGI
jgi:glycosyltransferase involved in cell wall biosynthesis